MPSYSPRVTVCVPVRNGALTISRTLDSILAQDYPNIEIIVSDNCSIDETAKIVQAYADRGVGYYLNPRLETYGESNWNHILSLATGPLIALYHADDIYTPVMVRRQIEFLEAHPETSAVFTMSQTIDEQDRPIRMGTTHLPAKLYGHDRFEFNEFFNGLLKYRTFVPVPTMMTRRSVLAAVGVFRWQLFASASDVDLYLRMARQWGPVGIIDEPLHKYRISSVQGSAVIAKNRTTLFDFFRVIDAHLSDPDEKQGVRPQSLAYYELYRSSNLFTCTLNLLVQGNTVEARARLREVKWKYFITALRSPPLLARLMIGVGLLIAVCLGCGAVVGRLISWARARRSAWLRLPVA